MKTRKIIAIAIVLMMGISTSGFSQAARLEIKTPDLPPQCIVMTLQKAMQSKQIVEAICEQVNPGILNFDRLLYTVSIKYNKDLLYISGTYDDWRAFFKTNEIDSFKGVVSILIPLQKAKQNKHLVEAMRAQINEDFLNEDKPLYIASVRFKHSVVYVSGTYDEWRLFLHIH